MEIILDRIEQFAENQGIKIGALEKKIGASKGVLSRAIAQKTDIQSKWLFKIVENYPQIDANWLLTGRGEMLLNNPQNGGDDANNGDNISRLITILQDTLVEKDKQIDRLLSIIEQGKV